MDTCTSAAAAAVMDALVRASSQDASVLKPAEAQLKSWEAQQGFYSILASVFLDHNIDVSVRWLAVLYFKNGVDRYWRRNAPSAIGEEEKDLLRAKLIVDFNEPANQIAVQLSVLIGKIARLDCPRSWPQLLPKLIDAVQVSDAQRQQRALLTFYYVIKSLASRRLAADRKVFEDLTTNIFRFVCEMWETNNAAFSNALLANDAATCLTLLDRVVVCIKVLRMLVLFGFSELDKSEAANEFMKLAFQRLDQFLRAKSSVGAVSQDLLPRREKIVTLLSKLALDTQEYHPEAFVPFIRPSLELTVVFNFSPQGSGLIFERFTVNMFNLMNGILRCEAYTPAKPIEETRNPVTLAAHQARTEFFTAQVLTELCRQLVLNYFPLTDDDLKCWQTDPESFISDESGDSVKFSLRPCQENLFLSLVKEFRSVLPHVILQLVRENDGSVDVDNLSAILHRDAVYCAVGLASYELYDLIDFDSWFSTQLLAELRITHPNYRIIRHRIVWLIGCWVSVKISASLRPAVYECVIPLMQRSEDMVVRLEAAQTVKISVDDFEFKAEQFSPYLEVSFSLLFQLLQDVSECDSKMTILHVMSFIIERMQAEIRPHIGSLIRYLPLLWDSSAEHGMLRCAIITTLTTLVQSIGESCVNMYDLLIPIIRLSTDVRQDSHVYLCEDGLDLWLATLHCSPRFTPLLLDLYTNMPAIFELGSETLKTCLKIVEAYILLAPKEFLQKFGGSFVASVSSLVNDLKVEGIVMIYQVIETILKVIPDDGCVLFLPIFTNIFRTFIEHEEHPMLTAMHLALLSRLILSSPQQFSRLLDKLAPNYRCTSSTLFIRMLDRWFDSLDNVIQTEGKKLSSLTLASLLTSGIGGVLDRFCGIISACVETLHDVCRSDSETGILTDSFVITGGVRSSDELETEHDRRRYQVSLRDPVHTVCLHDFLLSQLNSIRTLVGDLSFAALMQSLDVEISQQLQLFLKQ